MKLGWLIIAASIASACDKEHRFRRHDRHIQRRSANATFPPILNEHEKILLSSFDNVSIAEWSQYYSTPISGVSQAKVMPFRDGLLGSGKSMALIPDWMIILKYGNGSTCGPTLEEEVLEVDETSGDPDRVPAYHGYSFSGNATAEYVYVGRGQREDFNRLKELGIDLVGKIALAKYGGPFRGLKVKNAQEFGMIGAVVFTDPGDDRNMTAAHGFETYPNGPARNPSSIQRGSVAFLSTYPGDPTTPGYPSKEDSPRLEKRTVPSIPSLPISWIEVVPLLKALNGFGLQVGEIARANWEGAIPGAEYSSGPVPGVTLTINNVMKDRIGQIWNTIGIVNGTNEDEVVIVGNHHDAWMIGGAADPHSGSAILVELAKALGLLMKTGWKPRRTIVLASWDAEEYGLVGSTEWVEEYVPWLKDAAVSYLNIDVGIAGTIPDFSATPDLHALVTTVAQKVVWPHSLDQTLYDVWEEKTGEIGALGAQSDYTAFVHQGGIASIDIGTTRAPLDPIYHTHSNFDSFHWMTQFADPGFLMHRAIGQFLTLMLFHLVDDERLPLEPSNYGTEMRAYLRDIESLVNNGNETNTLVLSSLESSIANFEAAAHDFDERRSQAASSGPGMLHELNGRARDFSRAFIGQGGLPGRQFYQNLIFAPGVDTGYAPVTFPGITEAVIAGDMSLAQEYVGRTSSAILAAASVLSQ